MTEYFLLTKLVVPQFLLISSRLFDRIAYKLVGRCLNSYIYTYTFFFLKLKIKIKSFVFQICIQTVEFERMNRVCFCRVLRKSHKLSITHARKFLNCITGGYNFFRWNEWEVDSRNRVVINGLLRRMRVWMMITFLNG